MQTQTLNTLHNAIMEAGSKDRPPMLAPGNYVQWKSRIKRYIDTKPNHELIHYCLKNPLYKLTWADKEVPISAGSSVTTTERYKETYKNVSQDIRDQLNDEAEAVQIILTGIDNDIYSTVDACPNACEMWKAIERLKQGESINVQDLETNLFWEFEKFTSQDGESLESYYLRFYKMMNKQIKNQCDVTNHQVNVQFLLQLQPEWQRFVTLVKQSQELKTISFYKLYDILKQHQNEVNEINAKRIAHHNKLLSETEEKQLSTLLHRSMIKNLLWLLKMMKCQRLRFDKLMALISLSFKKIYKPTNNNLRTSSNTSRANQDNSPRFNRGTGYDNQRLGNVAGARETVGMTVVQKSGIQCYNCKEFGHVARECQKPKRAKDAAYHREKMLLCKKEEVGIQLNAEQANWRDDTDDESKDQELEAHYMYMAKIQEVSLDAADSGPVFDTKPVQKVSNNDNYNVFAIKMEHPEQSESIHDIYPIEQDEHNVIIDSLDMSYDREQIDQNDDDNDLANELQTMNMLNSKCQTSFAKPEFLKKAQRANPRLYDIGCYSDNLALMLAPESDEVIRLEKESRSKLSDLIRPFDYENLNNLYDVFVPQCEKSSEQRYFSERSRLSHTSINTRNLKESFNKQTTLLEKRMDESIPWDQKCKSSIEIFKIKKYVDTIFDGVERCKETIANRTYFGHLDPFIQNTIEANFSQAIRRINAGLEKFHTCLNEEMVADLRYFNSLELEVDSLRSQLETQKTQCLNKIDRLSREYYYADHMNEILGVYTELDKVTNLQCDYLELLEKCECLEKELSKSKMMSKSFESIQQHAINLELELQQCKEKMKNEKYFKANRLFSQILLKKKDFSKSKSVSKNNVSNDFSKPATAQILPPNKKSILKNTNMLAPGMYKLHTKPTQTRTSQLPNDSRKTNKRVSFSTGVIPTTSVSRPQLKSNPMEDRVILNNSQGKKQDVEDHRRNVKFSKNKKSVTACNDCLNAKTLNVNFVCATCDKCVLNEKHDMCVLKSRNGVNSRIKMPVAVSVSTKEPKRTVKQSVDKPLRKTVDSESNQEPRNTLRKLYECISKTCSWWYPKFTPSGYNWKPKSKIGNVKPNVSMPLGNESSSANILEPMTSRHSTVSNTPLSSNSFAARKDYPIHRRLWNDIVVGLPKLKFVKDHLCSSCELGKAKRKSFQSTTTPSFKRRLQLLHMNLCGLMRVASINGKRYVLVIVNDYSRYTWIHFLRSKDETPIVLIDFLRLAQRGHHAQVRIVRTDKGTEFLNQTLHAYFASEGILHQTAAKVPLFFWAEAIATSCFTQNRSLIIPRHEKTPYHIINDQKPSVKFFHIFGSLCYIVRDGENLDKMKENGDACIFVGYSTQLRAYRVFNKRTRMIVETIHVNFDELPQMASDHVSSDHVPECQRTVLEHISLSPGPQCQENVSHAAETVTTSNELDLLFSPMFDELLNGSSQVVSKSFAVTAADAPNQRQQQHTTPLNNQTTTVPTCQVPSQAPTVTSTENINQAEMIVENAQVNND
uniref:Retrovirus-related Pol polyprotein from transposon TNT 1-94 n=1 Tax=Tanacetum cinerariifolium TaxID=118510 RepID=A0A6L2NFF3_TANCI|nr:hypothetical protein [Tanacetum cinerariifolium]